VVHDRYSPSRHRVSKEEAPSFLGWLESYLAGRKTLTLATVRDNVPYCNLMTFAQVPSSCSVILVTPQQTTKYDNMVCNPAVSLMVSEVDNASFNHQSGTAVTLNGQSRKVQGSQRQDLEKIFAAKYPELQAFAASPNSAVFLVQMQQVVAVVDFQKVSILDIESS